MCKYQNIFDILKIHRGRSKNPETVKGIDALVEQLDPSTDSFLKFMRHLDLLVHLCTNEPIVHELLSLRYDIMLHQHHDDEVFKSESLSPVLKRAYDKLKNKERNSHATAMLIRDSVINALNTTVLDLSDPMPIIIDRLRIALLTNSLDMALYLQPVIEEILATESILTEIDVDKDDVQFP